MFGVEVVVAVVAWAAVAALVPEVEDPLGWEEDHPMTTTLIIWRNVMLTL